MRFCVCARYLRLCAIRFVRSCVGVKDTFFPRFIQKNDLLKPIFQVLTENGKANTMTLSTIAELMAHIVSVPIKPLLPYIVDKYYSQLDLLPSKKLVRAIHVADQQLRTGSSASVTALTSGKLTVSAMDKRVAQEQQRHRESLREESYFESDDDDDENGSTTHSDPTRNVDADESVAKKKPRLSKS